MPGLGGYSFQELGENSEANKSLPVVEDAQVFPSWRSSTVGFKLPHPRNDLRRQATSNHKGVYLKQRNKKWAARLCLKSRKKLDLGEYTTHDDAARAYQVGAFYYNKPLDTTTSPSFVGSLPSVPDNLSDGEKRRWVRERARHYALTVNGKSASKSVLLAGSGALEAPHGAQASYNFPTASGSALPDANELLDFDDFVGFEGEEFSAEKRKPEEVTGSNAGAADVQEKNQALPHITNATDSELFALYELRKQGWNYRLKSLSPISVKAGVLFALPQGQQTSPPLLMTDIILRSFQELREQGWEVHLEPSKRDESLLYRVTTLPEFTLRGEGVVFHSFSESNGATSHSPIFWLNLGAEAMQPTS